MTNYSGHDHYFDPAFGVLKNRLGITDETTLEQAEADFVAARSRELSQTPLKGRFDLSHLQAIHHYLFRDVYEWAGQLRTIDISKAATYSLITVTLSAPLYLFSSSLRKKSILVDLTLLHSATGRRITLEN